MASLIYNSSLEDLARGAIDYDTDTFYMMLVTSSYVPNKDTHTKRSDVTNEASGSGYSAGGQASAVTITKDTGNDRVDVGFATVTWATASVTAAGAVIYKRRGGASSADELVAFLDFGGNVTSTAGDFVVTVSSPYRFQN